MKRDPGPTSTVLSVQSGVLRSAHDLKVLKPIVGAIPVDMMHHVVELQGGDGVSVLTDNPIEYELSGCVNCGRLFAVPMRRPGPKDPWHCTCDAPEVTYMRPDEWFWFASRWWQSEEGRESRWSTNGVVEVDRLIEFIEGFRVEDAA